MSNLCIDLTNHQNKDIVINISANKTFIVKYDKNFDDIELLHLTNDINVTILLVLYNVYILMDMPRKNDKTIELSLLELLALFYYVICLSSNNRTVITNNVGLTNYDNYINNLRNAIINHSVSKETIITSSQLYNKLNVL